MNFLIHLAVQEALTGRPGRRPDGLLWVSDFGRNPYAALRRVLTGELAQFDYPTLLKMDGGNALEAFSLRQIAENVGRLVRTQFPLYDNVWSGYADLIMGHGTDQVIIADHKGSCGKWWDYNQSLPRATDCCQVWLYGELYHKLHGIRPELRLYYRGWGTWAEFEIKEKKGDDFTLFETIGIVTNDKGDVEYDVCRIRDVDPNLLKAEIENLYLDVKNGLLSLADIEKQMPSAPDWDYAEDTTDRLRLELA